MPRERRTGDIDGDVAAMDGTGPSRPPGASVLEPATVRWQRSYDRASVERFAAEVEAHRARLTAEIAAARAAAKLAEAEAGPAAGASPADLGELVMAAQRELEQLEREHRATIEAIRSAAEVEAERVLAAARAEVEAVRASASAISALIDRPAGPHGADAAEEIAVAAAEPPDGTARHVDAG